MNQRAEFLANRIEEGATLLADFAEGLSASEWKTPISETDRRTVGVVVHHVANMYPAEVQLAQAIAAGQAVTDVTWEVVAGINASHAKDNVSITKEATIEALRSGAHAAAQLVRELSDEELDRAAPFSLSFGAPVTAQFVIEDHALRHAWHHLARIRKTLGR